MTTLDNISLSDPLAAILYQRTLVILPDVALNEGNITRLTLNMMRICAHVADGKDGAYRKNMVVLVLKKVIDNNTILSHEDKIKLIGVVNNTIGSMIDDFVHISANKIRFKKRISIVDRLRGLCGRIRARCCRDIDSDDEFDDISNNTVAV